MVKNGNALELCLNSKENHLKKKFQRREKTDKLRFWNIKLQYNTLCEHKKRKNREK